MVKVNAIHSSDLMPPLGDDAMWLCLGHVYQTLPSGTHAYLRIDVVIRELREALEQGDRLRMFDGAADYLEQHLKVTIDRLHEQYEFGFSCVAYDSYHARHVRYSPVMDPADPFGKQASPSHRLQ